MCVYANTTIYLGPSIPQLPIAPVYEECTDSPFMTQLQGDNNSNNKKHLYGPYPASHCSNCFLCVTSFHHFVIVVT